MGYSLKLRDDISPPRSDVHSAILLQDEFSGEIIFIAFRHDLVHTVRQLVQVQNPFIGCHVNALHQLTGE